MIGVCGPMDALLGAYRRGAAVPYEAYGADVRDGIAALNRPMFANQLAGWLAAIPDVDARLRAMPPARVADLACGSAWSSIAIARAYPAVTVDAIDVDAASIETARGNVADGRAGRPGAAEPPGRRATGISMAPTTWSPSSRRCTT